MDTKVKPDIENLRINGDRLWASLMELAQICLLYTSPSPRD